MAWGILWRSENRLDGKTEYLIGEGFDRTRKLSPVRTLLFQTRKEARRFCDETLGYIKTRPDLRAEPHGWKTPKVVKVIITVRAAKGVKVS